MVKYRHSTEQWTVSKLVILDLWATTQMNLITLISKATTGRDVSCAIMTIRRPHLSMKEEPESLIFPPNAATTEIIFLTLVMVYSEFKRVQGDGRNVSQRHYVLFETRLTHARPSKEGQAGAAVSAAAQGVAGCIACSIQ